MKVYISGIAGSGMGPLALMAKKAGSEVCGSDLKESLIYPELVQAGIEVKIGPQDGEYLREQIAQGLDWFVYSSAVPKDHPDHPELKLATATKGLKCSKRDDFTAFLVDKLKLKMVGVAGTHGKTTTTSMIVWGAQQLGLPVAYVVGATLSFAPSGMYHEGDQFFVYEADEYDRNFLKFHPWLAVLPAVTYDHPDIYPTEADYKAAFEQFKAQSEKVIEAPERHEFKLAGAVRREDANFALAALKEMAPEVETQRLVGILNDFPGVRRRMEMLCPGVYTDYAHNPEEIAATMEIAQEEKKLKGYKGIVVLCQPLQNARQHALKEGYRTAFRGADKIYWLPTHLTREDPNLPILTPKDLIAYLENPSLAEPAEMDEVLRAKLQAEVDKGRMVVLVTCGSADHWLRDNFGKAAA